MGEPEPTPGRTRGAHLLLLELLFPGRCLVCGQWLRFEPDRDSLVCYPCRRSLVPIHGARCLRCGMALLSEKGTCTRCREAGFEFESNIALFPYSGAPRELIVKLKFEGRRRLAALFAHFASAALEGELAFVPVVPVPCRPGRGTPDAVELVARRLQKDHGKVVQRLLERTGGAQQKSLDFEQRRRNLSGMIRVATGGRAEIPPRVVLLDDVFTTGATLDACARSLRDGGCQSVHGLTLAIEE
jgi:ComF family protein